MSEADLEKAKANLASICSELGCEYKQVTENRTGKSGKAADFLLRYALTSIFLFSLSTKERAMLSATAISALPFAVTSTLANLRWSEC